MIVNVCCSLSKGNNPSEVICRFVTTTSSPGGKADSYSGSKDKIVFTVSVGQVATAWCLCGKTATQTLKGRASATVKWVCRDETANQGKGGRTTAQGYGGDTASSVGLKGRIILKL